MAPKLSPPKTTNLSITLRGVTAPRVQFGDVIYNPGGSYGPRVQPHFQIVMVEAGHAVVSVDGAEVRVMKGEAGLFRPGCLDFFAFSATGRTHHTWCAVAPELPDAALRRACAEAPDVLPVSHRLAQLIELGLGLPPSTANDDPGLVEALGLATLRAYLFDAHQVSGDPAQPAALQQLATWFGTRVAEPMDLPALAKVTGVSPAQLVKLCKRHLGTTPVKALWEARTNQGLRMLRSTGLTVSEIAYQCGFRTPFHFSRWVRAVTGKSPRAVRTQSWAAPEKGSRR